MDRKFLEGLGLEKEAIDKVMAEHGKAVQAAKPDDYDDLKSAKDALEKQVGDLNGDLQTLTNEKTELETNLEKTNGQVKEYELNSLKTRIANQAGLPFDLAGRLSGEKEDEIKADAEKFASFVSKPTQAPLKSTETSNNDGFEPYKNMLNNLKLEGE